MGKHAALAVRTGLTVGAALAISACKGSHAELSQAANALAASPPANNPETSLRASKSWRLVNPRFPPGAIIVKEKRETTDGAPVMMTNMVKHDKGFGADLNEWEFLVMDGAATKAANVGSCKKCHAGFEHTDFVTRLYLSKEAQARLR
jgi:hypothetical protein